MFNSEILIQYGTGVDAGIELFCNVGVLLHSRLLLKEQVVVRAKEALAQIHLVHQLCPFLDQEALIMIIHALITSDLDYCNVLYVELLMNNTWKL